jgi:hypothetical protein
MEGREWKSKPLEEAYHYKEESIGKRRAIPQRGTTHRWDTAPSMG